MKLTNVFRYGRSLALVVSTVLCSGVMAWAKPSIQGVTVTPAPLMIAQPVNVTVAASADVTQANAVLEFLKGTPQFLQVPLTKQGSNWTGTATLPLELSFLDPHKAEAKVRVLVLDAALRQAEFIVRVPVNVPAIAATFAEGVLTVIADDQDNTVVISRDAAGMIAVNGGAVFIAGDVPYVTNTTLVRVSGAGGNDTLQISDANGTMPPSQMFGGDGNDVLTGSNSADELDGGAGDDVLIGRAGMDRLLGGPGKDTLQGGQGEDYLDGGEGDDEIVWSPGDTSDVIEGQAGNDTLTVNGANIGEVIDIAANGPRLRFFRNIGNVVLDCAGVERVLYRAVGGADQISVNDLFGTEVKDVLIDLASSTGNGDLLTDTVFVNGSDTNDVITVAGSTNGVIVSTTGASITVFNAEPTLDSLVVNGLAGSDTIDASSLQAGAIQLTLNGGLGIDTLIGSEGKDLLLGGRDNDIVYGRAGDDTFLWSPGDGSDALEGEAGNDTLTFNAANIGETIDILPDAGRVRLLRNVAAISMDFDGIETVQLNVLGGSDLLTIGDLTGTSLTNITVDLGAANGLGDALADTIIVNGTSSDDVAVIVGTSAGISVQGLHTTLNIIGSEPIDQLIVRMLEGDDTVNASALMANLIALTLDGGIGEDVLVGSAGADILLGGDGDDVLLGGPGVDVLDGGTGNNIVIQD